MTWIIDLDGVVWLADQLIDGSSVAIAELRQRGEEILFTTNNSFPTIGEYVAKLSSMGIRSDPDEIVTSSLAVASLVPPGADVLVCGGPGIVEALVARGARCHRPDAADGVPHVDTVVIGFHADFDYRTLTVASGAVRAGARLVATNDDPTYPTPAGLIPGTGSLLAAYSMASGTHPVVAGKPYPPIVELVRARLPDPAACIVAGDRPSTDGHFARALGCRFGLVESGVTAPGTRTGDTGIEPDLVAENLLALVRTTP